MLEEIRSYLMERIYNKYESGLQCEDAIYLRIRRKIEAAKLGAKFYIVKLAVGNKFQVSHGENVFIVSLVNKCCSCREWDLSGIPCSHALTNIHFMKHNPVDYVDPYYSKIQYLVIYQNALEPLNGLEMWPEVDGLAILPPQHKNMPGRQKRNRKKDASEDPKNDKMSRKGMEMHCQHCMQLGHNKRACPVLDQPPAEKPAKGYKGRPRKYPTSSSKTRKKKVENQDAEPIETSIQQIETTLNQQDTRKQNAANLRMVRKGFGVFVSKANGIIYGRMIGQTSINILHGQSSIAATARESVIMQQNLSLL
ncbi:hypothetical protein GH714_009601 [Hevea brasiliensis]|uniref:SWIM-type domain-containing protein n=1 Tax=Hevea brasiliensis TaxID=3981 RepID=A0A6A6NGB9_HEVBR|nr:hypothetical protein GH714_009601 [Hevea brasiliensis]